LFIPAACVADKVKLCAGRCLYPFDSHIQSPSGLVVSTSRVLFMLFPSTTFANVQEESVLRSAATPVAGSTPLTITGVAWTREYS
jgi:hypothetical protein